ncbi:PH domain-containing protein [Catenuloplanes japonicus]|uniref:PH domain-containing protein n=1 Tax=Catenuloplanes japonicus TaxID=33876 RepID=UPI0012F80DC2|nr:PH domain-containing protein [Catenuloplanes japonicus]
MTWRVPRWLPAVKAAGGLAFVLLAVALAEGDPAQLGVAAAVCAGLLAWAARDVLAPVRLATDEDGLTVVTGFARRVRLPWSGIEAVRLDTRPRLGLRTETLEIDTGEALHVLTKADLGVPPAEILPFLQRP